MVGQRNGGGWILVRGDEFRLKITNRARFWLHVFLPHRTGVYPMLSKRLRSCSSVRHISAITHAIFRDVRQCSSASTSLPVVKCLPTAEIVCSVPDVVNQYWVYSPRHHCLNYTSIYECAILWWDIRATYGFQSEIMNKVDSAAFSRS